MSAVTSTNALAKDSTLQDVADAISTMGATSVGNLSALTTTDKTSLVGAVNEVKSGLTNVETLQTISLSSDLVLTGTITIKRNCGVNFVICNNITMRNDLAAGSSVEVCTAGTVENPPSVVTLVPLYAVSGGNFIAPVYLAIRADGGISVYNYSSIATKIYGYCCSAYI